MSQVTLTSDPLGSATTGTLEFTNPAFYLTPATSQRGVVLADQFILQQATYTLTSQTAAQKLFNVSANGQVTLVDARTAKEYSGQRKVGAVARAGTIPGAVNLPLFLLEGVAILAEVFALLIVLLAVFGAASGAIGTAMFGWGSSAEGQSTCGNRPNSAACSRAQCAGSV